MKNLSEVLAEVQRMQAESFGRRQMNISTGISYVNVTIFEKGYEDKEDGNLRTYTFYDFMDKYDLDAVWNRMIDYYG